MVTRNRSSPDAGLHDARPVAMPSETDIVPGLSEQTRDLLAGAGEKRMPESVVSNGSGAAARAIATALSEHAPASPRSRVNASFALFRRLAGKVLSGRGFWALTDQAILSLGNFGTGILLYNFLPTHSDIAIYGLILYAILFLNGLHGSLVTYTLMLKGAPADNATLRRLTGGALGMTAVLLIPLCIALAIAVWKLKRPELIPLALLALILWQAQETVRRALMAKLRHRDAVLGDAVSFLGQTGCIAILAYRGSLNLHTTLLSVALTSGLAAVIQGIQLGVRPMPLKAIKAMGFESWRYGRWLLITAFLTLPTAQAMPWVLIKLHGDVEAAHFGALAMLLGVANPVLTSVIGLIVPAVAMGRRDDHNEFFQNARRQAMNYGLMGACLLTPFFLFLFFFPQTALVIFSHGKHESYGDLGSPLRLFVIAYALTYPAQVMTATLNGLGHSRLTLIAQIVFAAVTLGVSLPLAANYGLMGAVWGGLFPPIAFSLITFRMLGRISRRPGDHGHDPIPAMATAPTPEVVAS